jgi:hypothetical protein
MNRALLIGVFILCLAFGFSFIYLSFEAKNGGAIIVALLAGVVLLSIALLILFFGNLSQEGDSLFKTDTDVIRLGYSVDEKTKEVIEVVKGPHGNITNRPIDLFDSNFPKEALPVLDESLSRDSDSRFEFTLEFLETLPVTLDANEKVSS